MDAALTDRFISAVGADSGTLCTSSSNSILTCEANIDASNCSGSFTCDTTATQLNCTDNGMGDMATLISTLITDIATGVSGAAAAIETALGSSGTTDLTTYLSVACTAVVNSQAHVSLPDIVLSNCKHVNLMAINRLDSNSQCLLSQATQVLRAAGLGTPVPDPSGSSSSSVLIATVGFFAGTLALAILIALVLRKRLASKTVQLQKQFSALPY